MQARGEIDAKAKTDNQALGIQLTLKQDKEGKKEILTRLVRRNPSKLFQLLGEPVEKLYREIGLTDGERKSLRRALSAAQTGTWDRRNQHGQKRMRVFRDINMLQNKDDFNDLLKPFLAKEGFQEGRIENIFSLFNKADAAFQLKVDTIAEKGNFPITITVTDMDWQDASMFQTGTLAMDRRARDMGFMAQARNVWILMHRPEILCAKDPKETLKKLKELRDTIQEYTSGGLAEQMTYELARSWLKFNRHRHFLIQAIPFAEQLVKGVSELDTRESFITKVTGFKFKKGDKEKYYFGEKFADGVENTVVNLPHKAGEFISYATRFTGPRGNAFEAKDLDKILDEMLLMGIFNADEKLYHDLRKEMRCGLGWQIIGLLAKYWWIAPLAAAFIGAKEGVEEEKKQSGGGR